MAQHQDPKAESSIEPGSQANTRKAVTSVFFVPLVVLGLALLGCDGKPRAAKKPPTPEQAKASQCFKRVVEEGFQIDKELLDRELELIASGGSTVSITLSRRRAKEKQCEEEARCLDLKEPAYSSYFAGCLKDDGE